MARPCALLQRFSRAECARGSTYDCDAASTSMWVSSGCRGRFQCGARELACGSMEPGRPGFNCSCAVDDFYEAAKHPTMQCGKQWMRSTAQHNASSCPCSEHSCWRRVHCQPSALCPSRDLWRRDASPTSRAVALVSALCTPSSAVSAHIIVQFKLLASLLASLRLTRSALPHRTLLRARLPRALEARLEELGTQMLPLTPSQLVPPPLWAVRRDTAIGSFVKLSLLALAQFEKVIFLDSDVQVLRNIDQLAAVEPPAFAFHPPDHHQRRGGLNSGVMVLRPDARDFARMRSLLPSVPSGGDGGDQAAWTHFFATAGRPVFELPSGFNFRAGHFDDAQRCSDRAYVIHSADARAATLGAPELRRHLYTIDHCVAAHRMRPDSWRNRTESRGWTRGATVAARRHRGQQATSKHEQRVERPRRGAWPHPRESRLGLAEQKRQNRASE